MFSRLSAVLQTAVDTIAPPVPLLHDFVYHWKQVMKFYDGSPEAVNVPIESTHLPIHLEQMLKVLQEEKDEALRSGDEQKGSPCLEYLLQHRIPDLLASLACADTPSGMKHLGLVTFSRLVTLTSERIVTQPALHEPIQRMVRLCGQVAASPTEPQEVRLLCVLAALIGRNPQLGPLFSALKQNASKYSSDGSDSSPRDGESLITEALLRYIDSADGRLRVKSCEALLVLVSQSNNIASSTNLAEGLARRLAALHRAVPLSSIDPADLEELPQPSWGMDNPLDLREKFPGCRQLAAFLSWLDFCDKIAGEGCLEVGVSLGSAIKDHLLCQQLAPKVLAGAEIACGQELSDEEQDLTLVRVCCVTLALVARMLRQCKASSLREAFSLWLVGPDPSQSQDKKATAGDNIREPLLILLEQAQGDLVIETMRLFEVIVEEPYSSALNSLVFSQLEGHRCNEGSPLPELQDGKYPTSQTLAPSNIPLVLDGFLQLVPPLLRSAEADAGYESYLQDAQRQYEGSWQRCKGLCCPLEVTPDDDSASSDSRPEADHTSSGLLAILLDRLERFPQQDYEVNLQLTALLSRLALLPHAVLHEALLSPPPLACSSTAVALSLGVALKKLADSLAKDAPSVPDLTRRLKITRHRLLGDPDDQEESIDSDGLLESAVVLEEFCKELAAIAFVKYHLHVGST